MEKLHYSETLLLKVLTFLLIWTFCTVSRVCIITGKLKELQFKAICCHFNYEIEAFSNQIYMNYCPVITFA